MTVTEQDAEVDEVVVMAELKLTRLRRSLSPCGAREHELGCLKEVTVTEVVEGWC